MGLASWAEYSLWGAKINGRNDGKRGIPGKTQKEYAAYERQLALLANRRIRVIATEWENKDRGLKGKYVAALRQFMDARMREQKEAGEAAQALAAQKEIAAKLDECDDQPQLAAAAYWLIIALVAFGEIPLTAQVFEIFGENKILTYIFSLVLCISVPTTAHFVGVIIKEKFSQKNLAILLTNGVVLIITLGVVSWLREKFFEAEGQELLGLEMDPRMVTCVFFAIQLLIFTTAATASYFAHDAHPGRPRFNRILKNKRRDSSRERNEAQQAEQVLDNTSENLAKAEAEREKSFSAYQNRAKEIVENCKMLIETYRGSNVRARGDAEITSFISGSYPEFTIPSCLQELDKECGYSVPESYPILCPICGADNHFTALRCIKCGNNLH